MLWQFLCISVPIKLTPHTVIYLNEHVAGTDPGDPDSRFAIVALAFTNSNWEVTWASSTGRLYCVSRSVDLFLEFLPVASNITAAPPYNTYRDKDSEYGNYYYRIETEWP
jgi:hypothetical protein